MGTAAATTHVVQPGIDIALWISAAKVLGLPIYDLLGGKVRNDILLYTHPDRKQIHHR